MLNTSPSTAPVFPRPPLPPRKRGGQPSNPNALKHGLYALKNPTPFSGLSTSTGSYRQILLRYRHIFGQAISQLQEKILLAMCMSRKNTEFRPALSWLNLVARLINTVGRLRMAWFKLYQPTRHLLFVSQHALAFIRLDFRSQGITRDADSFRENRELSDFNSLSLPGALHPFISPRQWAVLAPLLPPAAATGPRGRHPTDPRLLLDAAFWKFAHHARWQDLPKEYPPMLTCRRYYRRLFLSGRLATLYAALDKDLRTRGQVDLTLLVEREYFTATETEVVLSAGVEDTWQMRTALLFLQQAYQYFRHFQRQKMLEQRRLRS